MSDNIQYKFSANTKQMTTALNSLKNSFTGVTNASKKMKSNFNGWQINNKKIANSFANISKDANRASTGVLAFSQSMNRLNSAISIAVLYKLGDAFTSSINSAIAMTETTNLFNVSLGDMATQADESVQKMSDLFGLDQTNLRNSIGTYALLARSMGFSTTQASTLSVNMAQLATDLSSLTNVPINQVMSDLKYGLVGQSETVYKYGLDVTEAGLKTEALAEGITASVRNMTQGEKMALRYNAMLRQSGLAQGDFARTINTPANQLRILQERFVTLSRTIGTVFIPLLGAVLPYLNAVLIVITKIFSAIASIVGFKADKVVDNLGGGLSGTADDADSLDNSLDSASGSAKKLKNALMGFDEVNVLPEETDTGSGAGAGAGGGASILDDIELAQYEMVSKAIDDNAKKIASAIEDVLSRITKAIEPFTSALNRLWEGGLKKLGEFTFGSLLDFYNSFLVPIGKWAFGTEDKGITRLVDIINNGLNKIDWNGIRKNLKDFWTAIEPYAENFGEGLIDFFEDVVDVSVDVLNNLFGEGGSITTLIKTLNEGDPESARQWGYAFGVLGTSLLVLPVVTSGLALFSSAFTIALGAIGKVSAIIAGAIGGIGAFSEAIALWAGGAGTLAESFAVMFPSLSGVIGMASKLATIFSGISLATVGIVAGIGALIVAMVNSEVVGKAFSGAFEAIKGVLSSLWYEILLPLAQLMYDVFSPVISTITELLGYLYKYVIVPLGDFLGVIFFKVIESLAIIFEEVIIPKISKIIEVISFLTEFVLLPLITVLKGIFLSTFKTVFTYIGNLIEDLTLIFSGLIDFITGIFTGNWELAWSGIKDIFVGMFEIMKDTVFGIGNAMIGIAEGIANAFIDAFNMIKKSINSISITIPDWVPGFGGKSFSANLQMSERINIPRLANGGIVDSSRVVNVGEDGKEAIVPLENNTEWIDLIVSKMQSGETSTSSTMEVVFELNGRKFARGTMKDFEAEARRQGGLRVKLV